MKGKRVRIRKRKREHSLERRSVEGSRILSSWVGGMANIRNRLYNGYGLY